MKKTIRILLAIIMGITCSACQKEDSQKTIELTDMKNIAELSSIQCFYHNVAKSYQKIDTAWYEFWAKDKKRFWIEYSSSVTMGIDANLLKMEVDNEKVTITLPQAKVLEVKVEPDSLTKNSFYLDDDSAFITVTNEIKALELAQKEVHEKASLDQNQLQTAQQRAKDLLTNYVNSMGRLTGKNYQIKWKYTESEVK